MGQTTNVPARLHSVEVGNILTGADEILDDNKNKKQSIINQETDQALSEQEGRIINLEQSVGSGGTVDQKISQAKSEIIGDAGSDYNTLGKLEDKIQEESVERQSEIDDTNTRLLTEISRATASEELLRAAYEALTESDPEVISPTDTWPVANPEGNIIYRVVDRVNTPPQYYSDFMWNGSSMVEMARYNNAIDDKPTADSANLVESGGVYAADRITNTKTDSLLNGWFIDYNHLCSAQAGSGNSPHYEPEPTFDTVWVSIFKGTNKINISGVVVTRIRFFSSNNVDDFPNTQTGHNTTGFVPEGSVLALIALSHANNPDGYDSMVITQNNPYIQNKDLALPAKNIFIDYNKSVDGTTHEYTDSSYDTAWYIPDEGALRLKVEGVTTYRINFFSSINPSPQTYIDRINGTNEPFVIPSGTKLVLVTLDSQENINGYNNMSVSCEYNAKENRLSSRNIYIDYNHIFEIPVSGKPHYIEISTWDTAWIPIPPGASEMTCQNVNGRYRFFDDSVWTDDHYIGGSNESTAKIPDRAAFCLFIMKHEDNIDGYDNMFVEFQLKYDELLKDITVSEPLTPDSIIENSLIHTDGIRSTQNYDIYCYNLQTGKSYAFSGTFPARVDIYMLAFCDSNGDVIGFEYKGSMNERVSYTDELITLPEGCTSIMQNVIKSSSSSFNLKEATIEYYDIGDIKKEVDRLSHLIAGKSTKIVKNGTTIFVRTRLSDINDIMIEMYEEQKNMTFSRFYVGPRSLQDSELANSTYLVNNTPDMVGAIGVNTFWFLYAQHGWTIPRMTASGHQLDGRDIGSIWQDQNNRRFVIGNISGNYIYLLPEITQNPDTGIYSASWYGSLTYPTTITHVSGAVHTDSISGTSKRYDLIIQTSQNRKFIIDGVEITNDGEYYCDEFVIKEHIIGHNIGKVQTWFPNPVYNGSMIDWDRCFIFKGSSVTCNMIINTQYPFVLTDYRGCIPQMPLQVGNYHSYTLIPKIKKLVNGHRVDVPFNSDDGTLSSNYITVTRNATDLYDVNKQPERCITYMKDNSDNYLVGMAGGGSLLRGISKNENRNTYIPVGQSTCTYGGSSTPNKFYPKMLNGAAFESSIMPDTFIKEFSCYFCWFNPAENEGQQVYWYKDDDGYIVYAHCQTAMEKAPIRLPDFMEGMVIEDVIEKTDGTTLLTEQVISGCVYVTYDTARDSANYIVLKVK